MLECVLKEGISKKTGERYVCIEITFPNGFKKLVFPKGAAERYIFEDILRFMKGE